MGSRANKKALEAFRFKDERETAPWYHLASHTPSRRRPPGVLSHSRAVTGAPVAACAQKGSRRRNSKTMFRRPFRAPFHHPGLSLTYRPAYSSLPRLLVMQFFELPCSLHAFPPPVKGKAHRKAPPVPAPRRHCAQNRRVEGRNFVGGAGIGLQDGGKTAIIFRVRMRGGTQRWIGGSGPAGCGICSAAR